MEQLIRDLCSVEFRSKSKTKRLIEDYTKKVREETIREVKTCLPAPAFLNGLGKASYNEVEIEAFENGVYQTYVRIKKYLDTLNKLKK